MRKLVNTVQKQVGLMISVIGIFALTKNIIHGFYLGETLFQNLTSISVSLLFITIIPFTISIFIENKALKIIQIAFLFLTGFINIMDAYNQVYGPGMFFAAWLLSNRYGFFDKYKKIKYIIFLAALVVVTQISAVIHNQGVIASGIGILLYTSFIVMLLLIIWHDMVREQNQLRVQNRSLKINYTRIRDQLINLEEEQKPYDLKTVKITTAEERVIKTLTIYKASNREIAERLNIAEPTVKLHLYNIYNKIGVDNRFAIIDLCKYNYT